MSPISPEPALNSASGRQNEPKVLILEALSGQTLTRKFTCGLGLKV